MYLRTVNLKKGDTSYRYLKLVESTRVRGKPVQKILLNFGNMEDWPEEKISELIDQLSRFYGLSPQAEPGAFDCEQVLEFGAGYALDALWNQLGLSHALREHGKRHAYEIDIVTPVKAMVFNRLLEPHSKLGVHEWVRTQAIPEVSSREIPLHHYYRSLDYLMRHKESLEEDLFWKVADIFTLDLSLVFYDLTSSYFTGEGCSLAKHGYSRDHRPDCHQIEIGLLVNRDGIPLAHQVWEGNTSDPKTVPDALETLSKRFRLKRCVFVGDSAMAAKTNLDLLRTKGYEYIMSLKLHKDVRVRRILEDPALPVPERFALLKDNLRVYELPLPGPGFWEDERVIICFNPERAEASREKRALRLEKGRTYLQSVVDAPPKQGRPKAPEKIRSAVKRGLKKQGAEGLFTHSITPEGKLVFQENTAALDWEHRTDGVCILLTNAPALDSEEVAQGYRTLFEVEQAFRELKSFLKLRPVYHYTDLRVRGHVFICVLAYLLETVLEQKLHAAGIPVSAQKALRLLKPIHLVQAVFQGKRVGKRTSLTPEQEAIYHAIGIPEVPKIPVLTD
jgi:hypothetical protein